MRIPLFYWPSKIAWVDDDELFLRAVGTLAAQHFSVTSFNHPQKILDFFSRYNPLLPNISLLKSRRSAEEYGLSGHLPMDIDAPSLAEIKNRPERKEEISVIVTDFHMPGMNGVELCRQLSGHPVKKILLTGMADYQQASDAFNEGLIDCFLRKDSADIAKDLLRYLRDLERQYFIEQTRFLGECLESDTDLHISDPVFMDFLQDIRNEWKLTGHYLIDRHCNFVLTQEDKELFWLIVHTDESLDEFVNLYRNEPGVTAFVEQIESRKKIPWFGQEREAWQVDASGWEVGLHDPVFVQGRKNYYVSLIFCRQ